MSMYDKDYQRWYGFEGFSASFATLPQSSQILNRLPERTAACAPGSHDTLSVPLVQPVVAIPHRSLG